MAGFKRVIVYTRSAHKRNHEITIHMFDGRTFRFGIGRMQGKFISYDLPADFLNEVEQTARKIVTKMAPELPEGHEQMSEEESTNKMDKRKEPDYKRAQVLLAEFQKVLEEAGIIQPYTPTKSTS